VTKFGPCAVAVIAPDDGSEVFSVWLTAKVLFEEFKRLRPRPGERVGIRRLDDADHFQRWAVEVDRDELDEPLAPLALAEHAEEE
jgi:hypothetical protein